MAKKVKFRSFEEVLKANGETPEQFNERTKGYSPDTVGYEKGKSIALAYNGGKHVKRGYFPWFRRVSGGVGLSYCGCGYYGGGANVASCLLMENSDDAVEAGQHFTAEYAEFI